MDSNKELSWVLNLGFSWASNGLPDQCPHSRHKCPLHASTATISTITELSVWGLQGPAWYPVAHPARCHMGVPVWCPYEKFVLTEQSQPFSGTRVKSYLPASTTNEPTSVRRWSNVKPTNRRQCNDDPMFCTCRAPTSKSNFSIYYSSSSFYVHAGLCETKATWLFALYIPLNENCWSFLR